MNQEEANEVPKLKPLMPTSGLKKDKRYEHYIKIFKDITTGEDAERACNIAITGSYGSGKSSLIQALKKDVCKHHVTLSLATFLKNDASEDALKDFDAMYDNETLQMKILQQLYYQISWKKSLFLSKDDFFHYCLENSLRLFVNVFVLLGLIMLVTVSIVWSFKFYKNIIPLIMDNISSIFEILKTDRLSCLNMRNILFFLEPLILDCFSIAMLIVFCKWKLTNSVRSLKASLKLKKLEVEMENDREKNNETLFKNSHYLRQVVYLFECDQDIDTVFIEDFDRLQNPVILSELRELNRIINYDLQKHRKTSYSQEGINRVIRFIYAIGEETFDGENRLKFFDYIIPIVPFADTHTSYNRFLQNYSELKASSDLKAIFGQLDWIDVKEYFSFVTNMRMVNDIFNEAVIFYLQLKKVDNQIIKDCKAINVIFCLIVYKVMYPEDYTLLLKGKGILKQVCDEMFEQIKAHHLTKQDWINTKKAEKILSQIHEPGLMKSIVCSTYFDEEYVDYLSYPKLDTFTDADINLYHQFRESKNPERLYDKGLDYPQQMFDSLKTSQIRSWKICNYGLFDYAFKQYRLHPNKNELKNKFEALCENLLNRIDDCNIFANNLYKDICEDPNMRNNNADPALRQFLEKVYEHGGRVYKVMMNQLRKQEEGFLNYLYWAVQHGVGIDKIKQIDFTNVANLFEKNKNTLFDYIDQFDLAQDKILKMMNYMNIQFDSIDSVVSNETAEKNKEVLLIVEYDLFKLNVKNLSLIEKTLMSGEGSK